MAYRNRYKPIEYIPPNTIENQYLARDQCCDFSSSRFDESLTRGRITRAEVDDFLHGMHQYIGNPCQNVILFTVAMTCSFFIILGLYIAALSNK